jgi:cytidyltransferase-like protein
MEKAVVTGSFDDLRSHDVRFLEEAARLGDLHVFLWSDELVRSLERNDPKVPLEERLYLLQGIRYVSRVHVVDKLTERDSLPYLGSRDPITWVVDEAKNNYQKRVFSASNGVKYHVVKPASINGFPNKPEGANGEYSRNKKVVVTGCYDWFHSGHMRFFEEASELGDLYVVVGSDENVRLLKGDGHPMLSQDERRYMVQSVRFVKRALISSGSGWMDAEPEIAWVKPDLYVVNKDGDKPEKRDFCEVRGIQYVVLKRIPKEGLQKRQSTVLRGF